MPTDNHLEQDMATIAISDDPIATKMETPTAEMKGKGLFRPFRFMDLPIDLRLVVYDFILGERSEPIKLCHRVSDRNSSIPTMDLSILRTCRQVYHESNRLVFKRPVEITSHREQIFFEDIAWKWDPKWRKPNGMFTSLPETIELLGNTSFRSRMKKVRLNLEYLNGGGSLRYTPLAQAQHMFAAFPSLETIEITIYGSKDHYILTQAEGNELYLLKRRLIRLIGSIPKHVKILLSNRCWRDDVTVLDCSRVHNFVGDIWDRRPDVRSLTFSVDTRAFEFNRLPEICYAFTGPPQTPPISSPIHTLEFKLDLVNEKTCLLQCWKTFFPRFDHLRTIRFVWRKVLPRPELGQTYTLDEWLKLHLSDFRSWLDRLVNKIPDGMRREFGNPVVVTSELDGRGPLDLATIAGFGQDQHTLALLRRFCLPRKKKVEGATSWPFWQGHLNYTDRSPRFREPRQTIGESSEAQGARLLADAVDLPANRPRISTVQEDRIHEAQARKRQQEKRTCEREARLAFQSSRQADETRQLEHKGGQRSRHNTITSSRSYPHEDRTTGTRRNTPEAATQELAETLEESSEAKAARRRQEREQRARAAEARLGIGSSSTMSS